MQVQQQTKTIQVLDNAPLDQDYPGIIERVGNGVVKCAVDANRYNMWRKVIAAHEMHFMGDQFGNQWGYGATRGKFAGDTGEAQSFVVGQLTYLEQKAIARWYTPRKYQEILAGCIDYSAGAWAKAVNYEVSDQVGMGHRIAPGATDIPLVDLAYALVNIPVELGGVAYDYTIEDLVTSAFLGQPLPERKQSAAVEAYMNHMNRVALLGELNFQGFYKNSSVTTATRTSGAVWDAATADTIIADIIAAKGAFVSATAGNDTPTIMAVPLTTEQLLDKPRAATSDLSIKKYVEANLNVKIVSDYLLETAGGSSSKRVVFAHPVKDSVVLHIPRPIVFQPPQFKDLRVYVPSSYKYAGCEIRRTLSVRYMDGV